MRLERHCRHAEIRAGWPQPGSCPAGDAATSMQAQAERERQARVILGDSEKQVAEKFGEAAKTYVNNPVALHLRAMNMLYEGLKQNSTIVIVPSSAVETMQLGGLAGLTALTMDWVKNAQTKGRKARRRVRGRNLVLRKPSLDNRAAHPQCDLKGKIAGALRAERPFSGVSP